MNKKNILMPIAFLQTLGLGGISVAFFMIPHAFFAGLHKGFPMATWSHTITFLENSDNMVSNFLIIFGMIGTLFFALWHIKSLITNLKLSNQSNEIVNSEIDNSNAEATKFAKPLAIAMTVNVSFILGALFVPNLHTIFEYLFPFAIIAFTLIFIWQLKLLKSKTDTLLNINGDSKFSWDNNNSFVLLLIPFSLLMVAVGLAAPAAMSHNLTTQTIAFVLSLFTLITALVFTFVFIVAGITSIINKGGISAKAGATIWIFIPIITLVGITLVRLEHSVHTLSTNTGHSFFGLILTVTCVLFELIIIYIGYNFLKKTGYLEYEVHSKEKGSNISVFGLICPGVALSVMTGLVAYFCIKSGLVQPYDITWYLLLLLWSVTLTQTIKTLLKLNKKYS